jgi:DNA polymerase V
MHLALNLIQAGFPSPADDYTDSGFDIGKFLVDKPAATFFVKAQGESMESVGIFSGDLLVVDKSKNPTNGDVVIAFLDGEFTVKKFIKKEGKIILRAANKNFKNIDVSKYGDFQIWGVVKYVIHNPNG